MSVLLAAWFIRARLCSRDVRRALPSAVRIASFRPPRAPYPSIIIDVFLCIATADYAARHTPAAHSPRATWVLIARDSAADQDRGTTPPDCGSDDRSGQYTAGSMGNCSTAMEAFGSLPVMAAALAALFSVGGGAWTHPRVGQHWTLSPPAAPRSDDRPP